MGWDLTGTVTESDYQQMEPHDTVLREPWMDQALCPETDPELFFPEAGSSERNSQAIRVCAACPVRLECLDWAFRTGDRHAILGGLTPNQRSRVRRTQDGR